MLLGKDLIIIGIATGVANYVLGMVTPKLTFLPDNVTRFLEVSQTNSMTIFVHTFISAALGAKLAETAGVLSITPTGYLV